jgi:hypothetical protein
MSLSRPTPPYVAALECLLTFCAPLPNERPWQFLPADDRCYGPVGDPGAALAALRREYPDELLVDARLMERLPSGGWPRPWATPPGRSSHWRAPTAACMRSSPRAAA